MTRDSNSIIKDRTIRKINRNMKQTIGSNNMGMKIIISRNKLNSIDNKKKSKKTMKRIKGNSRIKEISIIIKMVIVRVRMSK